MKNLLSVIHDPSLRYPSGAYGYSPDERFPEYPYADLSEEPNPVYRAVRELFEQAGLDRENFGLPTWNPLGEAIPRGSRVFVLCNFVTHRRINETVEAFLAKCTHGSVLRAVIDYVLIAVGPEGRVAFGNAPIQSCDWEKVLDDTGASSTLEFYRKHEATVQASDLRNYVESQNALGFFVGVVRERDSQGAVAINLGSDSLLEELGSNLSPFTVQGYDPRVTARYHDEKRHEYLINAEALESDVILSLPKLKVHEKVGLTCALKGFVGTIGDKDCLAHHRIGSPETGGDAFPKRSGFLRFAENYHYWLCMHKRGNRLYNYFRLLDRALYKYIVKTGRTITGAWYGNNTTWRMSLDIVRILTYGTAKGTMEQSPQRRHLMLVDGIVGGENAGPLKPDPVESGLLVFSTDLPLGDLATSLLIGLDPRRIPLIWRALQLARYPVHLEKAVDTQIWVNHQKRSFQELSGVISDPYVPQKGWVGHVELGRETLSAEEIGKVESLPPAERPAAVGPL